MREIVVVVLDGFVRKNADEFRLRFHFSHTLGGFPSGSLKSSARNITTTTSKSINTVRMSTAMFAFFILVGYFPLLLAIAVVICSFFAFALIIN